MDLKLTRTIARLMHDLKSLIIAIKYHQISKYQSNIKESSLKESRMDLVHTFLGMMRNFQDVLRMDLLKDMELIIFKMAMF